MKKAGDLAVKYIWPDKDSGINVLVTRMAVNIAVNIMARRIRRKLMPKIGKLFSRRKAEGAEGIGKKALEELPQKAKHGKRRIIESKPDNGSLEKKGKKVKKLLLVIPVIIVAAGVARLLKKKLAE